MMYEHAVQVVKYHALKYIFVKTGIIFTRIHATRGSRGHDPFTFLPSKYFSPWGVDKNSLQCNREKFTADDDCNFIIVIQKQSQGNKIFSNDYYLFFLCVQTIFTILQTVFFFGHAVDVVFSPFWNTWICKFFPCC